jgi:hypothetical protein
MRITTTALLEGTRARAGKQGLHGPGARSAATPKHGMIMLRHVISTLDKVKVLRRLGFRFSVLFFVILIDRVEFSEDPSQNDVVTFLCPSSLPPSS